MRTAQHLIKALAIALATFIILGMFTALVGGVTFLVSLTGGESWQWSGQSNNWTSSDVAEQQIKSLDLNVKATNVRLRQADDGELVRIETNNEYISSWTSDGVLNVVEKSHGLLGWGGTGEVVVYLRKDARLENVKLEIGAGSLTIEKLDAKWIDLNLGAGRTEISSIKVTDGAKIDGGAGVLVIQDGDLRDARIDLGAGKAEITAKLTGHSKVDSGVGKVELNLSGNEKEYTIKVDKGLGSVTLNGTKLSDNAVWGSGSNDIEIESGVGAVEIKVD